MDSNEVALRRRFEELAPWHANGTLSEQDRRWVDDYVRNHPRAAAQLDWYRSLQERVRADVPDVSPDLGLERLLHRVRTDVRRSPSRPESLLDRLLAPIRGSVTALTLRPVYAYAGAALIVLQAGAIGGLLIEQANTEQAFAEYRSLATTPVTGPVLLVSFKADAKESDIRHALVDVGGTIVAGPGQLGQYTVSVAPDRVERAALALRGNAAVEAVEIATPPR